MRKARSRGAWVGDRVVHARRVDHAGQHRTLRDGQLTRRAAEVAAARLLKAVVAVAVVRRLGVHGQDLLLGVAGRELDRQGNLRELGAESGLAGCVQHLGELLLDRRAALVAAVGDVGLDDPPDRERVDPWLAVETLVLGGDEGPREVGGNGRPRVGDAVEPRLRARQLDRFARGRSDQPQRAGCEDERCGDGHGGDSGTLPGAPPAAGPGSPGPRRWCAPRPQCAPSL